MKSQLNFVLWKFCLIFCASQFHSQTQLYKSSLELSSYSPENNYASIAMKGNTIVFNASNYHLYGIDKTNYKTLYDIEVNTMSNKPAYFYQDTFFYGTYKNQESKVVQFDLNSGNVIKQLPFESMVTEPHIVGNTLYFTGLRNGGRLISYDLEKDQILWDKFIGHGSDYKPDYQKDKIVVSVDKNFWSYLDYNGKDVPMESKKSFEIGDTPYFVIEYEFLTHDGKEISQEFLWENQLTRHYSIKKTKNQTFVLSNNRLMILGNNKNVMLNADFSSVWYNDFEERGIMKKILQVDAKKVWLINQDLLMHYDFKKEKILRIVNLDIWRPHQLILDNRTIWLISQNDGQLYALDFEPDEAIARKLDREKAIKDRQRCDFPNPKKITAAKAVEDQFKNNN